MNNKDKEQEMDDLVSMLDNLVSGGVGRINVVTNPESNNQVQVNTINSTEFSCVGGACCQPTELLDEE